MLIDERDLDMSDPAIRELVRHCYKEGILRRGGKSDPGSPCIYIMAPSEGRPIKCGATKNLEKRRRYVGWSRGVTLGVKFVCSCADMTEAFRLERRAHKALRNPLGGEWFDMDAEHAIERLTAALGKPQRNEIVVLQSDENAT